MRLRQNSEKTAEWSRATMAAIARIGLPLSWKKTNAADLPT